MKESQKTKAIWGAYEHSFLQGKGIDIGSAAETVCENAVGFDLQDGDANQITQYVSEQFDFVFSSHCLEHMHSPEQALREWWQLVRPNGHMILIVPDEDLYEQGFFPSIFNPDHKATFTISKQKSWSPRSFNLIDLVKTLPQAELLSIQLHDHNYDRSLVSNGNGKKVEKGRRQVGLRYRILDKVRHHQLQKKLDRLLYLAGIPIDQTTLDALAQIQVILKKTS